MLPMALTQDDVARLLAPGRALDLLLEGRGTWQRQAVRQSSVLERDGGELVILTPSPPLPSPLLGLGVEVTALDDGERGERRRYAYRTNILDVLDDHPNAPGAAEALVVIYPSPRDVYATSLRKAKRFPVPPDAPLGLSVAGQPMRLLDISLKGMRFSDLGRLDRCHPGDGLELLLAIHDQPQKAKGRVAAVNRAAAGQEISLELGIMPLDVWTSLSEALLELEHAQGRMGDKV